MHQNEYKQAYFWCSGSWDSLWYLHIETCSHKDHSQYLVPPLEVHIMNPGLELIRIVWYFFKRVFLVFFIYIDCDQRIPVLVWSISLHIFLVRFSIAWTLHHHFNSDLLVNGLTHSSVRECPDILIVSFIRCINTNKY